MFLSSENTGQMFSKHLVFSEENILAQQHPLPLYLEGLLSRLPEEQVHRSHLRPSAGVPILEGRDGCTKRVDGLSLVAPTLHLVVRILLEDFKLVPVAELHLHDYGPSQHGNFVSTAFLILFGKAVAQGPFGVCLIWSSSQVQVEAALALFPGCPPSSFLLVATTA